jgi:uncharacterized membrane protein
VNGFGVSVYLAILFRIPYLLSVFYVIVGEAIACYGLGLLLLVLLERRGYRKGVKRI